MQYAVKMFKVVTLLMWVSHRKTVEQQIDFDDIVEVFILMISWKFFGCVYCWNLTEYWLVFKLINFVMIKLINFLMIKLIN